MVTTLTVASLRRLRRGDKNSLQGGHPYTSIARSGNRTSTSTFAPAGSGTWFFAPSSAPCLCILSLLKIAEVFNRIWTPPSYSLGLWRPRAPCKAQLDHRSSKICSSPQLITQARGHGPAQRREGFRRQLSLWRLLLAWYWGRIQSIPALLTARLGDVPPWNVPWNVLARVDRY